MESSTFGSTAKVKNYLKRMLLYFPIHLKGINLYLDPIANVKTLGWKSK